MPHNSHISKIYGSASVSTNNLMTDSFEMQSFRSLPAADRQTPIARTVSSASNDEDGCGSLIASLMIFSMIILVFSTLPFSLYFCLIIVHDHEKAVLFRNGRLHQTGSLGPGLVVCLPLIDQYCIIDCRLICHDIPPQRVLTKDSIGVDVDAVVLYRVHNAIVAVTNVEDYAKATHLLAATHLRNICGTKTLAQILADADQVNDELKTGLDMVTVFWGVRVERIDIKNVRIPQDMQLAMSAEAMAKREGNAKLIAAEGELMASKALTEAADVMDTDGMSLQLRFLQTLTAISNKNNNTFVVPLPTELFQINSN